MTMLKNHLTITSALFASLALTMSAGSALAQSEDDEITGLAPDVQVDLKEVTCWDVVTLAEDDRGFFMTMLYGHALGQKGDTTISPEAVEVSIVLTITDCVEKPDDKVLDILKEKMTHREQ